MIPQDDELIFTEGINYHETGRGSIWGTEEKETLHCIRTKPIQGKWINLCAGDGRFNTELIKKVDQVIACDIDKGALSKLWEITPEKYRSKLQLQEMDVKKPFPFKENSFDGVFCTGALHLFPENTLRHITNEIYRVLKPEGQIIIDYATDITRTLPDGSLYIVKGEPNLKLQPAIDLLHDCFQKFSLEVITSIVKPEEVFTTKHRYVFSSNFVLLYGTNLV